jgi:hypothetical protein
MVDGYKNIPNAHLVAIYGKEFETVFQENDIDTARIVWKKTLDRMWSELEYVDAMPMHVTVLAESNKLRQLGLEPGMDFLIRRPYIRFKTKEQLFIWKLSV